MTSAVGMMHLSCTVHLSQPAAIHPPSAATRIPQSSSQRDDRKSSPRTNAADQQAEAARCMAPTPSSVAKALVEQFTNFQDNK